MSDRLPLFPLATVLVPGTVLPLHLFEPRYLQLARDLVAQADRRPPASFGVVAVRQGREVGTHRLDELHSTGCVAEVLELDQNRDGSVDLLVVGRGRFRLTALDEQAGTPYLTGLVDQVPEPVAEVDRGLVEQARAAFEEYCERLGLRAGGDDPSGAVGGDPTLLSYLITASMVLDLPDRQALLDEPDARARLLRAVGHLRRERTLWRVVPSVPAVDLSRAGADPR